MPACEVETDGPTPVVHEQSDVAKVELIEQGGKPVRVAFRMMILAPAATRRQAEADMVRRNAAELRAKLPDRMTEFERPGRVAVHEHDRLAFALVDEVHPVSRRDGEKPALEGIQVIRHPVRTKGRRDPVHPAHNASSFARQPVQPCTCSSRISSCVNRECVRVRRVLPADSGSNSTVTSVSTSLPSQRQV